MSKINLENKEFEELFHEEIVKSCTILSLQKLLLIWYNCNFVESFYKKLKSRKKRDCFLENNICFLNHKDIMDLLSCCERTAKSYETVIKTMFCQK